MPRTFSHQRYNKHNIPPKREQRNVLQPMKNWRDPFAVLADRVREHREQITMKPTDQTDAPTN